MFTAPTGAPINPSTDYHEWKRLLKAAGLREARLHDARHTAATVLLILGQPERTVMSLMGWSSTNMTQRYQHVTDVVRAEVAPQVGGLIWEARSDGSGEQTVLVRRDSLATILPFVERGLLEENGGDVDLAVLEAALADLRTAMTKPGDGTQGGSE